VSLLVLFLKFSFIQIKEPCKDSDMDLGFAVCKGIAEVRWDRVKAGSEMPVLPIRLTFTFPPIEGAGFVTAFPDSALLLLEDEKPPSGSPRSRETLNKSDTSA
jgi:hypothetical protein